MPPSLINNDPVPSAPRSPMPPRGRTSSLLPVPTRSSTSLSSSLRGSSAAQSPSAAKTRSPASAHKPHSPSVQYPAGSIRTPTRLPSRQPSFSANQSPLKATSASPISLPTSSPSSFSRVTASPSSVSKSATGASAGLKKPADKANDEQSDHFRNLSKSFNHTLRRIPRISTVSITVDRAYPLPTSLTTPIKPGSRHPTTSSALPLSLAFRQPPPLQPSPIALQQTRKTKSYQELKKVSSAAVLSASKRQSPHPSKINASPESLQSKSTLTDDGASVRTKLEYSHNPSISSIAGPMSEASSPDLSSDRDSRPADLFIPPQAVPSTVASSEHPEPQEFQSRAYTLERLQSLVGLDEFQSLVDSDALYRLISQPALYETQLEIQERAFQVYVPRNTTVATDGQKSHGFAHTQLGFDIPTTGFTATVPHATLDAAPHHTPASTEPLPFETAPFAPTEVSSAGPSAGPRKSSHVGNILLEKLGWKSKSSHAQSSKHGTSKSISKALRPSSFILVPGSQKAKLSGQYAASGKTSMSEAHRFSQILGARLETMNCSTCVVLMGERFQVLPILPFTVIEEIYRRGMRIPGILRISGDLDRIDELVKKFEFCPKNGVDVSTEDIHTLCGLLKHYLRTLSEPLFHPILSHMFWKLCVEPSQTRQADPTEDEHSQQLHVARYLLQLLPSRALSLLTYVIRFLAQIPTFAENRVQHDSLAVMLGPAIFVPRDIGLPGLGLHPRGHNKQASSTIAPSVPWPSPSYTASFIEEVDKSALSQRAADSTLWLMNHSKSIFGVATDADRRRTGVPSDFNLETTPRESVSSSLQDHQEATSPPPLSSQLTGTTHSEQLVQSPPQSPGTSILTYSSGLTVSQPSTIHEESPQVSPSSSLHSQKLLLSEMNQLSEFGYGSIEAKDFEIDPAEISDRTPRPGMKLDFPARLGDQSEAQCIDTVEQYRGKVANRLSHSMGAVIGAFSKQTTEEVEKRDRRNSEKVIGLLTHYIEGREEKIVKQESLIESLVEEIGRLHTVEERDALMREKLLKQTHIGLPVGDEVKSRGLLDQEDFELDSTLTAQTSHTVPDKQNEYIDYHEQMFNFLALSPNESTVELPEVSSSGPEKAVPEAQPEPTPTGLDFPTSDRLPHAHRLSKSRLFDVTEERGEEEAVEELRLGTSPSSKYSADSPKRIRRTSKLVGLPHSWRKLAEPTEVLAGKPHDDLINFDDYDSDHSNTASLHSEISRLKSINSNLIRKLKSIESILADVSFT
ncbi:hypothetical protein PTTG_26711 [Puccinia triticina 1-1 BBBD Race 1]|uniref:Rho-GAP domain-containing protein n=1 Tax=Puccinia triticina (isolate 1-1 / race 1 (BBBD)) TaxID=630390 RepID=A0A180GSD1_PUCT1|nr:hypothetical protein PTTG_26711 [Puccinia triticina 1-1 BBBD Race 1]